MALQIDGAARKNAVARLFFRFFLFYAAALAVAFLMHRSDLLPQGITQVGVGESAFVLLALLAGILTVAKPFLFFHSFLKRRASTLMVFSPRSKGELQSGKNPRKAPRQGLKKIKKNGRWGQKKRALRTLLRIALSFCFSRPCVCIAKASAMGDFSFGYFFKLIWNSGASMPSKSLSTLLCSITSLPSFIREPRTA